MFTFRKEVLRNRAQHAGLAMMGSAPIFTLSAYKVLEELGLERNPIRIARFVIIATIISGITWALFPASKRRPLEDDEEAVRDSYSPQIVISIGEAVKDAEDEYIRKLSRERARNKEKKEGREKDTEVLYSRNRNIYSRDRYFDSNNRNRDIDSQDRTGYFKKRDIEYNLDDDIDVDVEDDFPVAPRRRESILSKRSNLSTLSAGPVYSSNKGRAGAGETVSNVLRSGKTSLSDSDE